jgi:hypothetical protein
MAFRSVWTTQGLTESRSVELLVVACQTLTYTSPFSPQNKLFLMSVYWLLCSLRAGTPQSLVGFLSNKHQPSHRALSSLTSLYFPGSVLRRPTYTQQQPNVCPHTTRTRREPRLRLWRRPHCRCNLKRRRRLCSQMGLATRFQTNMNSRVVPAGGIDLFSDEYARKELPSGTPSGNSQPAGDIAAWVLQEVLIILRIDSVEHHHVN